MVSPSFHVDFEYILHALSPFELTCSISWTKISSFDIWPHNGEVNDKMYKGTYTTRFDEDNNASYNQRNILNNHIFYMFPSYLMKIWWEYLDLAHPLACSYLFEDVLQSLSPLLCDTPSTCEHFFGTNLDSSLEASLSSVGLENSPTYSSP